MADANGLTISRSEAGTPPSSAHGYHRGSRKDSPGQSDPSNSPVSRTNTPGLHHQNSNIAPQHMFDSVTFSDHNFNPSVSTTSVPTTQLQHPSPGSTSSTNDRQQDAPQTYDSLLAANTSLKTRVSELEFINQLFRGRVSELEQSDATARRSEMFVRDSESQLRKSLQDAQRREDDLKRRIDDLERQISGNGETTGSQNTLTEEPQNKKARLSSDGAEENSKEAPQSPQSQ